MRYGRLRDEVNKLRDENALLTSDKQLLVEQITVANDEAKAQAEHIKRSRQGRRSPTAQARLQADNAAAAEAETQARLQNSVADDQAEFEAYAADTTHAADDANAVAAVLDAAAWSGGGGGGGGAVSDPGLHQHQPRASESESDSTLADRPRPCDDYRIDVRRPFGDCMCGAKKAAHAPTAFKTGRVGSSEKHALVSSQFLKAPSSGGKAKIGWAGQ